MDFAPTASITGLASAAELPKCNACHKAPVTNAGYSTCRPCRDKRNEMKKRSQQKKREQKFRLLQAIAGSDNIPFPAPRPTEKSASAGKKRKAPEDEESLADALERMRKRFKKMEAFTKVDVASKSPPVATPEPVFKKFVSAGDLHKTIKRRYPDNSNSLRFYGTYAIIALPDVDNKHRARQVARDLRDNTTLHFNLENKESYRNGTAYTIHYKCTCRASSIKRTASDLSLYFGSKNKTASEETPKSECRGRIEICAEDDRSHPQGWLGQRVKVTITHPKKI
ncbi:hypothetical protein MVEN_00746400 [Mycena venus]|uniref:Uncharacterized protein n=1 Tax=Mycena venus TaxID=2733690 RepID=A0A8H7D628_9AGAR|nr:hypothetical protein MVEN_00746400 [Mycena venus]